MAEKQNADSALAGEFDRYVIMNILSMIGMSIYILADTYFISLGIGSAGLAALNLALPVYNLVNGVGLLLGIGGASRFIISRTQNRKEKSDSAFSAAVLAGLAFGMIGILAACFASGRLAVFPGADGTTFASTEVYLKVILLFSPAFVNEMASGIVMFVFNFLILRLEGNDGVAAYGILANILIVILAVYNGLAQGSQPVFGRAYGLPCRWRSASYLLSRFRRRKT